MADEIERKFLMATDKAKALLRKLEAAGIQPSRIEQGYLHAKVPVTRVRIVDAQYGYFTVKGPRQGLRVPEYEWPIPIQDAREMLDGLCSLKLEKLRYPCKLPACDHVVEVDVFQGGLSGLVLAEIEFKDEASARAFKDLPDWLGQEVSDSPEYTNLRLAQSLLRP